MSFSFFFFLFFLLILNQCRTMALTTSLPSLPLAQTKAAATHPPSHHLQYASESATAWPHHPCNSPTPLCPTWSPPHPLLPLPQLHCLHLDTATCCCYDQCHLDLAITPPFAGTPATPLHLPSHMSQAHIGPATLQLR